MPKSLAVDLQYPASLSYEGINDLFKRNAIDVLKQTIIAGMPCFYAGIDKLPTLDFGSSDDPMMDCARFVDGVLAAITGKAQAMVSLGGQTAIRANPPAPFTVTSSWLAEPTLEPLGALAAIPAVRGVGLAGVISGWPNGALADGVVCFAKDTAIATKAAQDIASALAIPAAHLDDRNGNDPMGQACRVPTVKGHLDPEQTWDALAPAARLAVTLRQDGVIKGAAVSVRGRGRLIGNVQPSPLLRFRASEWR